MKRCSHGRARSDLGSARGGMLLVCSIGCRGFGGGRVAGGGRDGRWWWWGLKGKKKGSRAGFVGADCGTGRGRSGNGWAGKFSW